MKTEKPLIVKRKGSVNQSITLHNSTIDTVWLLQQEGDSEALTEIRELILKISLHSEEIQDYIFNDLVARLSKLHAMIEERDRTIKGIQRS